MATKSSVRFVTNTCHHWGSTWEHTTIQRKNVTSVRSWSAKGSKSSTWKCIPSGNVGVVKKFSETKMTWEGNWRFFQKLILTTVGFVTGTTSRSIMMEKSIIVIAGWSLNLWSYWRNINRPIIRRKRAECARESLRTLVICELIGDENILKRMEL